MKAVDLGILDYEKALEEQQKYTGDLLFFSCPSIFTCGRKGTTQNKMFNIPLLEVSRGGSITYHGPSQLICFPSWSGENLNKIFGDQRPVKKLTDFFVRMGVYVCKNFKLEATSLDSNPGIYIDRDKIGALGFRITIKGLEHGFALNIEKDENLKLIFPCDLNSFKGGSLNDYISTNRVEVFGLIQEFLREFFKN